MCSELELKLNLTGWKWRFWTGLGVGTSQISPDDNLGRLPPDLAAADIRLSLGDDLILEAVEDVADEGEPVQLLEPPPPLNEGWLGGGTEKPPAPPP